MKNLVLIGMPGSGKTKIGRLLAERFGLPLVDTDEAVTARSGRSVPQLFEELGEAGFRDLESQAVAEAAALDGAVIATGGGVVLRRENMEALRATGVVFFRDRDVAAIAGEDHGGRPLLGSDREAARARLLRLYEQRIGLYRRYAHHIIPHTDTYQEAEAMIAALFEKEVSSK